MPVPQPQPPPPPHLAVGLAAHLAALAVGPGADGEQHLVVVRAAGHGDATATDPGDRPRRPRCLNAPPLPPIGLASPRRPRASPPIGYAAVNSDCQVTAVTTAGWRCQRALARAGAALLPASLPFLSRRVASRRRSSPAGGCGGRPAGGAGGGPRGSPPRRVGHGGGGRPGGGQPFSPAISQSEAGSGCPSVRAARVRRWAASRGSVRSTASGFLSFGYCEENAL